MSNPREDHVTNFPEDAAHYESWRGQTYDDTYSDRPTKVELDAEAAADAEAARGRR